MKSSELLYFIVELWLGALLSVLRCSRSNHRSFPFGRALIIKKRGAVHIINGFFLA